MERAAFIVGGVLFASGLAHVVILLVTGGSWLGPLSFRKPATFGLSFGLTLATVAWATSFVTVKGRTLLLSLFGGASVMEVVLVSLQAWRGVPSHFNFETPFDSGVSMALAAGGGVLVLTAVLFTISAITGARAASPTMRVAVRFGMVALIVALGTGAAMIASGVAQARSGDPQLAYTTAGALKPLHAVAMHAILVLPVLAWLLDRTRWAERDRMRLLWAGIVAYSALIVVVGVESITGVSPLQPPAAVAVASVVALVALVAVGSVALYGLVRAGALTSGSTGTRSARRVDRTA